MLKKNILFCITAVFFACLLIWITSIVKCEILTYQHGMEFSNLYQSNTMIGEQQYWKVLEYSDTYARVYFVASNRNSGNILTFVRQNGVWVYNSWEETVWSRSGSADGFVWPYIR